MGSFYNTEWAEMMMSTARSKSNGKPVANNTRLFDNGDGSYRLRLHNTDIVTYNADGTWTISAGGWTTVTTAQRVREYSPIKLLIESGEWYVWLERRENDPQPEYVAPAIPAPFTAYDPGPEPDNYAYGWWQKNRQWQDYLSFMERFHNDKDLWAAERKRQWKARRDYLKAEREWVDRNRIPFYDGITVNEDGYAPRLRADGPSPAKLRRHEREVKRVKKAIDTYVNGFIAALKDGTLPMPSSGDCWYCAMRTESGQTMGDASQTLHSDGSVSTEVNTDHLWSHIEESYYVPSLAVNALRERGYKDVGIYFWLDMDQDTGLMGKPDGSYDGVKRDIVKYMSKRLIPSAPTE
jgi:hypothetical protein